MREKSPENVVSFVPAGSTTAHLHVTVDVAVEVELAFDALSDVIPPRFMFTALQPSVTQSSRSSDHHEHQNCWNSWFLPPIPFPDTVVAVWVVFIPHASVRWYVVLPRDALPSAAGRVALNTTLTVGPCCIGLSGPPLLPPGPTVAGGPVDSELTVQVEQP